MNDKKDLNYYEEVQNSSDEVRSNTLSDKTNRTELVYLMFKSFVNITFETQDQCKRFQGAEPPKTNSIFNNGVSPPWAPLELTTGFMPLSVYFRQ